MIGPPNRPWSIRTARRFVAGALALALLAAACGGAVTESEEYLELQDRFDEVSGEVDSLTGELGTAKEELDTATEDLSSATADLEASEERVTELEGELRDAQDRATAAEDALEDELSRPWPDAVKRLFVEGCVADDDPAFTDEEEEALCICIVDELEAEVSFEDFMVFSMAAFLSEDAPIDPLTGLPEGLDEDFVNTIGRAGVTCAFRL